MGVRKPDLDCIVPRCRLCYIFQFKNRNQYSLRGSLRYELTSFLLNEDLDAPLLSANLLMKESS